MDLLQKAEEVLQKKNLILSPYVVSSGFQPLHTF